jgi:hypothetical protein
VLGITRAHVHLAQIRICRCEAIVGAGVYGRLDLKHPIGHGLCHMTGDAADRECKGASVKTYESLIMHGSGLNPIEKAIVTLSEYEVINIHASGMKDRREMRADQGQENGLCVASLVAKLG